MNNFSLHNKISKYNNYPYTPILTNTCKDFMFDYFANIKNVGTMTINQA